jgi:hypothetical protein
MASERAAKLKRRNVGVDGAKVKRPRRKRRESPEVSGKKAMAALERIRRRGTWGKRLVS